MRCIGMIAALAAVLLAATPAAAANSYFEITSAGEVVSGPPYPTVWHGADVAHEANTNYERDGRLALGIRRAFDGVGDVPCLDLKCLEDSPPGGGFDVSTGFELRYDADREGDGATDEFRVVLMAELYAAGGRPGRLAVFDDSVPIVDPGRYFDAHVSGVSAEFTGCVQFDRGIKHELSFLIEVPTGVTLTEARVIVREQTLDSARSGSPELITSYFVDNPEARFDVVLTLTVDDSLCDPELLAALTLSGRFLGGSSPVQETTWGGIKARYGE